ncbi:hypothetical protein C5B95_07350 [Rathayibacter sp. AY1A7]|nr:hypothetical protein C5B95_07350 [Rathayibacter sp. AY1A7]
MIESVEAEQYAEPTSARSVAALVKRHRPGVSFDNMNGSLRFYNSGTDMHLQLSDWAVSVGGQVVVMRNSEFVRWATPISVSV